MTRCLLYKQLNVIVFCKYSLILNLMAATRSEIKWDPGKKKKRLGKLCNAQKTTVWGKKVEAGAILLFLGTKWAPICL